MEYYYIRDLNCFARGDGFNNYIYKDGNWEPDKRNIVSDRLMGYDPYEDDDSPYKIGNTEIMAEIETITAEEFANRTLQKKEMTYTEYRGLFKNVKEFKEAFGKLTEAEAHALISAEEKPAFIKACMMTSWRLARKKYLKGEE